MDASQLEAYLPLVLLVLLGYLLLIRPARRRARAAQDLQAALSPGDEVMMTSGLFGEVKQVSDQVVHVEIAPGMVVRVHRGAVSQIITDHSLPPAEIDPPSSAGDPAGDDHPEKS